MNTSTHHDYVTHSCAFIPRSEVHLICTVGESLPRFHDYIINSSARNPISFIDAQNASCLRMYQTKLTKTHVMKTVCADNGFENKHL